MPILLSYFLKLSISLAVVYLFYQFVLRRLTFYNSNRWYLVVYTLLSFAIPLIDITPVLEQESPQWIGLVPVVEHFTGSVGATVTKATAPYDRAWNAWDWLSFVVWAGACFFALLFVIKIASFYRMRKQAKLISADGLKIYQVNRAIIPFSFGKEVFINSDLHSENELREIIRHEFVHVRQHHTLDILWSEWLCIITWFNPFSWLLKASIRQNLEFIADNKVLQHGVDRKQYQYLLLKVIGNDHFSIAQKFNFSSLKKRITMMNKMKTARLHLVRFLFLLPLLAVVLLAFRREIKQQTPLNGHAEQVRDVIEVDALRDTVPYTMAPTRKGYFIITTTDSAGQPIVIYQDRREKEIERMAFSTWQANLSIYEKKYGTVLPPPPPPDAPAPTKIAANNEKVKRMQRNDDKAEVWLKDGTHEQYDLSDEKQKAAFDKKYSHLPLPPLPPAAPPPPPGVVVTGYPLPAAHNRLTEACESFDITDRKAVLKLKNGKTETYDFGKPAEKAAFEKKYGSVAPIATLAMPDEVAVVGYNAASPAVAPAKVAAVKAQTMTADPALEPVTVVGYGTKPVTGARAKAGTAATVAGEPITGTPAMEPVTVVGYGTRTVSAPMAPAKAVVGGVQVDNIREWAEIAEEDILATITSKTTQAELDALKQQLSGKGITLTLREVEYSNGRLVQLAGNLESKDGKANFVANEFSRVILAMVTRGDRKYFTVQVRDRKTVI